MAPNRAVDLPLDTTPGAGAAPAPVGGSTLAPRPPVAAGGTPQPARPAAAGDSSVPPMTPAQTFHIGNRAPWGQLLAADRPGPAAAVKVVPATKRVSEPPPVPAPEPLATATGPAALRVPAEPKGPAEPKVPTELTARISFPALLSELPPPRPDVDREAPLEFANAKHDETDKRGPDKRRPDKAQRDGNEPRSPKHPGSAPDTTLVQPPGPARSDEGRQSDERTQRADTRSAGPDDRAAGRRRSPAARDRSTEGVRWQLDGLRLPGHAPRVERPHGPARFAAALQAAQRARPTGPRPEATELRRWSAALEKAGRVAPDRRTRAQLRRVARYVLVLARTDGGERADLQRRHPDVVEDATALRTALARRFGVSLLG